MKLDYCYHTHTIRCGHAVGSDEDFVKAAIECGIRELGFSDHVFIPGLNQPQIRGSYNQLDEYVESIRYLKNKYKDKINIYVGFEAEYSKFFVKYYKKLLKSGKIDYLICGQHFLFDKPNEAIFLHTLPIKTVTKRVTKELIRAIKSGLFKYIAHPDHFLGFASQYEPFFDEAIAKICKCAKKYDVPLEINLHGIFNRTHYGNTPFKYPCDFFFKKAVEVGCKIIIGYDAHNPDEFINSYIKDAQYLIDICSNNLINRIKLI